MWYYSNHSCVEVWRGCVMDVPDDVKVRVSPKNQIV